MYCWTFKITEPLVKFADFVDVAQRNKTASSSKRFIVSKAIKRKAEVKESRYERTEIEIIRTVIVL